MTEPQFSGDDIARAITTAQQWLRTQAPHVAPVDALGQTCPCPLCKVVATVREIDPESAAVWVNTAVSSFTSTLATYMGGAGNENSPSEWQADTPTAPTTVVDEFHRTTQDITDDADPDNR